MTRGLIWMALTALTALTLSGCTGAAQSAPPPSPTSTTSASVSTPPGGGAPTAVPVAAGTERTWPQEIGTVSEGEREFVLFGVHRIADERVVVTGRFAGKESSTAASGWFEPGYFRSSGGYEFSRVVIVGEDQVRHLPVRDDEDRCLCSLSTSPYDDQQNPQAPAWVVLSAPAGAKTVDVEVVDVGVIKDVPVTDLPAATSAPFGWAEALSVESIDREEGIITARMTIANVGDLDPTYTLAQHEFGFLDLQSQGCFQGLAAWGAATPTGRMTKDEDCHRGSMPRARHQITLEVKIADPGSGPLFLLPDAGLPLALPATGSPAKGQAESLRSYTARTDEAGAMVDHGDELTVNLDTAVLFEFDMATLTGEADKALSVAAKTLKAQDKRAIVITGHTDGQGGAERNMQLSEQRAKAVAEALGQKLGSGWDIAVEWYGMTQPAVMETGTPDQIQAAQARNRRVEIVVP